MLGARPGTSEKRALSALIKATEANNSAIIRQASDIAIDDAECRESRAGGQLPGFNPGQRRRLKGLAIPARPPDDCASLSQNADQRNTSALRWNSFAANLVPSSAVFGGGTVDGWEARIDAVSIWQDVMTHFEQLEKHLLDDVLVFANLIQIPAVTWSSA
jgi:hypothetical protein